MTAPHPFSSHHRLQPPAAVDGPNDARQSVSDQSAALWPVADIVGSPIRCSPYAKPSPRGRSHRSSLRGTTARRVEAASSDTFFDQVADVVIAGGLLVLLLGIVAVLLP